MNEALGQILLYIRGIWKYRWTALITAWLIAIGGWIWVSAMPNQYEASTRVYIDTDSLLRPLLKGLAVETDIEQRLQMMTRTLLSRPNIEKLIGMTDMDINITGLGEREKLILTLQQTIQVQSVKSARSESNSNFYIISYTNKNPDTARRVVQSLLDLLMDSSLGDTRTDSANAREFIERQIAEYEAKLRASEERLGEFKRRNRDILPDNEGDYFKSLRDAQDMHSTALLDLKESQNRRDAIKQQIDDFIATGVAPTSVKNEEKDPKQERLQGLYTKLGDLLLRFTEQHPDVKELRLQIEALETQITEDKTANQGSKEANLLETNTLYQQLRKSLSDEEANISAVQVRVNEYSRRIDNLNNRIEQLQKVETELKGLDRDYELNKSNYEALVTRRESADLAGEAERTGNTIQFRIIDPPYVPEKPAGPRRILLDGLVLLIALGGGAGVAFLLAQNNPAFFGRKMLQTATGLPVFGAVTKLYSPRDKILRQLNHSGFVLTGIMLGVLFVTVVLLQRNEHDLIQMLQRTMGQFA